MIPPQPPSQDMPADDPTELVYQFILHYWRQHGHTPTVRQICEERGYYSTYTASYHIRKLEEAGRIRRVPGHRSALEILDLATCEWHTPAGNFIRVNRANVHMADQHRISQLLDGLVQALKR